MHKMLMLPNDGQTGQIGARLVRLAGRVQLLVVGLGLLFIQLLPLATGQGRLGCLCAGKIELGHPF